MHGQHAGSFQFSRLRCQLHHLLRSHGHFFFNAAFVGVVVAPNADVQLNGSGDPTHPTDFIGCLMANTVTMNGHFNFHYDEALGGNPAFGRFLITSWNEIKQ